MPFAWTAIHLVDIISGASTGNVEAGGSVEKDVTAGGTPTRRVRTQLYQLLINSSFIFVREEMVNGFLYSQMRWYIE